MKRLMLCTVVSLVAGLAPAAAQNLVITNARRMTIKGGVVMMEKRQMAGNNSEATVRDSIHGFVIFSLVAALAWLCPSAATAHDHPQKHTHLTMTNQPRTAMTWYRDLVYDRSYKDPDRVSLDIYVPDPVRERMPVVLFVHGGGFRSSDKAYYKDLGSKPDWLTRDMGAIFIPMNFRFLPDGGYPNSAHDVANALAWVHDNIGAYGGDPSRIVLMAHATGIFSAGLVATDDQFLRKTGKSLDLLRGFIGIDGAFFDVTGGGFIRNMLPSADAAQARAASPIHHIARGKKIPPALILYGGQGGDVGPQSEAFAAALRTNGLQGTAIEMFSKDHFTVNEHVGVPGDETTIAVARFLQQIGAAERPVPQPAGGR